MLGEGTRQVNNRLELPHQSHANSVMLTLNMGRTCMVEYGHTGTNFSSQLVDEMREHYFEH